MADYKELIRKAIQALPENNGAARRAVYEKARAALVGQLRGLNPPLAARDITQHRLQLEDCIRQVEQEASEAVIAGLKQNEELPPPQAALPPPSRPTPMAPPRAANAANGGAGARPAGNGAGARPAGAPRAGSLPASRANAPVAAPRPAPAGRPGAAPKPQAVPRVAAVQPKSTAAVAAASRPAAAARSLPRSQTALYPRAVPAPEPELEEEDEQQDTIEDIIAAAESDSAPPYDNDESAQPPDEERPTEPPMFKLEPRPAARKPTLAAPAGPPARAEARPMPAIVARAEAAKAVRAGKANEAARRPNGAEIRRDGGNQPARLPPPPQPGRQLAAEPAAAKGRNPGAAMSSVREVEVEPQGEGDPQVAIERAIATLEREARNDGDEGANGAEAAAPNGRGTAAGTPGRRRQGAEAAFRETPANNDAAFARGSVEQEKGGGSAVTIFLLVFLVLLIGAGGAGFWAWREGYIDFDAMFGKAQTSVAQIVTPQPAAIAPKPGGVAPKPVKTVPVSGSGTQTNTEAASNTPAQSAEAMSAAPATATASAAAAAPTVAAAEPSAQSGPKSEERLPTTSDAGATPAAPGDDQGSNAGGTAAAPAGSQSLLLEASQDGTTGAVPFSGTVEWSKGTDEMGQPTLVGKASIPARNLGVSVLIRRNADPTLPASHLMEINFTVNDSFIGGAISGLPGVLLKNEELVQGTPLVGASARVVGNSFLFALSSSAADEATNKDLLTSRKWIDLAIIYATGKKAIITLEKDDKAEALFNDVFGVWQKEAAVTPAAAAPAAAGK